MTDVRDLTGNVIVITGDGRAGDMRADDVTTLAAEVCA